VLTKDHPAYLSKVLALTPVAIDIESGRTSIETLTRTPLKAWSSAGVAAADLIIPDAAMELYNGADVQRGFANTADAFNKDFEPPTLIFDGK
jgi:hypothetical protein